MQNDNIAILVVWRDRPIDKELIEDLVSAAARILPETAITNNEIIVKRFGKLFSESEEISFLPSYISRWDGKTIIPVFGDEIFNLVMQNAIEDGVIYVRTNDVVVFEPLPKWEIDFLLGGNS